MFEPLLLANSYTHTLRPARSRASTLAKETRTASHAFWGSIFCWSVVLSALLSSWKNSSLPKFLTGGLRVVCEVFVDYITAGRILIALIFGRHCVVGARFSAVAALHILASLFRGGLPM